MFPFSLFRFLFSVLAGPRLRQGYGDARRSLAWFFARCGGGPPPLALARRRRASLGPQALILSQCSRGPTPARARSATSRLARAAGAHPPSLIGHPPSVIATN